MTMTVTSFSRNLKARNLHLKSSIKLRSFPGKRGWFKVPKNIVDKMVCLKPVRSAGLKGFSNLEP